MLEKVSGFMKKHADAKERVLPLFIGGDFNSMPISSVLSVIHDETNIGQEETKDDSPSQWKIPVYA